MPLLYTACPPIDWQPVAATQSLAQLRFGLYYQRERRTREIETMNISKDDGIAQLSKWHSASTPIRAIYRTITGNALIVGKMSELSPSAVKITGNGCEMLLYFRDSSEYEYTDARDRKSTRLNSSHIPLSR